VVQSMYYIIVKWYHGEITHNVINNFKHTVLLSCLLLVKQKFTITWQTRVIKLTRMCFAN